MIKGCAILLMLHYVLIRMWKRYDNTDTDVSNGLGSLFLVLYREKITWLNADWSF